MSSRRIHTKEDSVTMIDRWNIIYQRRQNVFKYGDDVTYKLGMDFLSDCKTVEDWGCGSTYSKKFCKSESYIGIDGSYNVNADKQADLATYESAPDGIFMRHVLEHNYDWRPIIANAMKSFKRKMALIIFTPFSERERLIYVNQRGIPIVSLPWDEFESYFKSLKWRCEVVKSHTQYHHEFIYYIEK